MKQNATHTGDEEYCFFLAVIFPDNQLKIIDYNRVVKDLNGLASSQLIAALGEHFTVEKKGREIYTPDRLHNFAMYLDGEWYSLTAKEGTYNDNDPIGVLDVTILSDLVLDRLLGIKDLRTDKRIDFVGDPGAGRIAASRGQRRNAGCLCSLSRIHETIDRHRRFGEYHASEDHMV